jgi:prefoldin subunit 5
VLGEKKEDEEGFESLGVTPDEIQRKMSRIEEKLGPLSKEVEKIPALVQQGKFEEADKKADSLLKQIEKWNPKAYAALKDPPASPKIDPAKLPPSLRQKLQSLQANIQNWEAEGKDLSQFESDLKKVEPLIQKGEAKEAEALIDKLLKKFDSVSKPN